MEEIDIGELEHEIKKDSKNGLTSRARKQMLDGILCEDAPGVKPKKSLYGCSDAASTRNRVSRLLMQSL